MMFPEFPENSKVWIYTANRQLSEKDKEIIAEEMSKFLPQWAAHGNSLFGNYSVEFDCFLILVVDESQASASGCSIDSSVHFIKELGAKLNVDFFNRLNMVIDENGVLKRVHISDLKEHPEAIVFNPMITNLGDLRSQWQVKVAESPFV